MIGTTLLFLLIQGPATYEEDLGAEYKEMTEMENPWALGGLIGSMMCFCGYLFICYQDANASVENKRIEAIIAGIKSGKVTLAAALKFEQNEVTAGSRTESNSQLTASRTKLLQKKQGQLNRILKPFFTKYDKDEPKGSIDEKEFEFVCSEMGIQERAARALFNEFKNVHTIGTGKECDAVDFPGFVEIMKRVIAGEKGEIVGEQAVVGDDDDDDEEEEMPPEDLKDLDEVTQRRRIAMRAMYQMGLGTFLVLVFSDPFVEVLSEWGKRMGIPGFYVSFVLAPFASNASELLSAYNYALKKTKASITTSFSTLIGAACMNNTFCLGIFLALVWYKQLAWTFTAETMSIMFSQWLIGALVCFAPKQTHTMAVAWVILAVYPLCIAMVYVLENYCGLD
jgi:Ca2+/Na+ antiporter